MPEMLVGLTMGISNRLEFGVTERMRTEGSRLELCTWNSATTALGRLLSSTDTEEGKPMNSGGGQTHIPTHT